MRLLFHTHYFHPEVGAAQTRILETATLLGERGHEVTVLTGFPNYPDGVIRAPYRGRLVMQERMGALTVLRAPVYPAPNRGFARRLANHASFALSSVPVSARADRVDAVIAETPPLFTAGSAVAVARGRRAALVLNVSDLWPESAVQLGMLRDPRAIRAAEALERFAYRHAAAICVPTPGMARMLCERGQPAEKVVHLANAVDVERFRPSPAPRAHGGAFRVVYCGTVGMAQGVGTLVEAARELAEPAGAFLLDVVGDGAEREHLERRARELGLEHVRFHGPVPREQVPAVVAGADACVMSLRDLPLFEDAVPTKLLEYMAAGKPVVAAASGQVAALMRETGAGIACPPEEPAAMAAALRAIASDRAQAAAMGRRGREHVTRHLSRQAFVEKLEAVAADAVERSSVGKRRR